MQNPAAAKIAEKLGHVLVGEGMAGLQFDDQFALHQQVGEVISEHRPVFVENLEGVLLFNRYARFAEAVRQGIPFLGEIPIFTEIREGGDRGVPVVISAPEKPAGQAFIRIALALQTALA